MSAGAHKPTSPNLHRRECWAMAAAFVGVAVSLRACSTAELGSFDYGRYHNPVDGTESSISPNHARSPAVKRPQGVTRNTFIAPVCYVFYGRCHRQGGTRCGPLRSTSPAASSRITRVLAVDRSST